jgi:hypothetical protein
MFAPRLGRNSATALLSFCARTLDSQRSTITSLPPKSRCFVRDSGTAELPSGRAAPSRRGLGRVHKPDLPGTSAWTSSPPKLPLPGTSAQQHMTTFFCTLPKANLLVSIYFRTLSQKHPGWGLRPHPTANSSNASLFLLAANPFRITSLYDPSEQIP